MCDSVRKSLDKVKLSWPSLVRFTPLNGQEHQESDDRTLPPVRFTPPNGQDQESDAEHCRDNLVLFSCPGLVSKDLARMSGS